MDCDPIVTSGPSPRHAPSAETSSSLWTANRPLSVGAGSPRDQEVRAMAWVMVAWSIVTAGLIVWLADAQDLLGGCRRQDRDDTSCACCRHDRLAHGPDAACTQCPCEGYRPPD